MPTFKPSEVPAAPKSAAPPAYPRQRRSTRVWHQISLLVRIRTPGGRQIEELGQSFVVNAHGGLLLVPVELNREQSFVLINPSTTNGSELPYHQR
jgi:hypothetical protein